MTETSVALLTAVVTATPSIAALVGPDGDVAWVNPAFVTRWPCAQRPSVEEQVLPNVLIATYSLG